jgi:hypothetical protein
VQESTIWSWSLELLGQTPWLHSGVDLSHLPAIPRTPAPSQWSGRIHDLGRGNLAQIAAVRSAVGQAGRVVPEDHVESCLLTAAADGTASEGWVDRQEAVGVSLKKWRFPHPGDRMYNRSCGSAACTRAREG